MQTNWPKQGKNIVLYPRTYHVCEKDDDCWVEGFIQDGHTVRLYLRLQPLYKKSLWGGDEKKFPPRIAEYARTARAAPKACIATPNNAPGENREGILLFSRVFPLKNSKFFEAGWCVLLAQDRNDPDPLFGIGRMEIDFGDPHFDTDEIKIAKEKVSKLRNQLLTISMEHSDFDGIQYQLESAEDKLREVCQLRFRGIQEFLGDIRTVKMPGETLRIEKLRADVISAATEYTTKDGRYGGCVIRTISADGKVFLSRCGKMAISYRKNIILSPDEMFSEWIQFRGGKKVFTNIATGDTVEIIPFQQINCGPMGNSLYRKRGPYRTIRRIYKTVDGGLSRDCPIAIRPIKAPSNGNMLLGSIYALSIPIGNVLSLNENALPVYPIFR